MKKYLILFTFCLFFSSCSSDDDLRKNPYLTDLDFVFRINLDLPQYNDLNFPGNHFTTYNQGLKGIVIYNLNNSHYIAFELTDPNHPMQTCSKLERDGLEAVCGCDDQNRYSILTGELVDGQGEYPLKPYRVTRRGNVLEISNR